MLYSFYDLNESCEVCQFDGDEAALVAKANRDDWGGGQKCVGFEPNRFGDCWVKFYRRPLISENGSMEIGGIECHVQGPGEHPGGRAWWATPTEDVFTPVYEEVPAETDRIAKDLTPFGLI